MASTPNTKGTYFHCFLHKNENKMLIFLFPDAKWMSERRVPETCGLPQSVYGIKLNVTN